MLSTRRWIPIGLGLVLVGGSSARAGDLTKAQRDTDTRLAHTVTYSAPQVYVGELLEEFSRQTGVTVKPGDPRDGAADFRIDVTLSNVLLRDAMSALWGLMSYRGAEWDWRPRNTPNGVEYELLRPPTARSFPARLAELPEIEFEAYANRMFQAAPLSPKERAKSDDPIIRQLAAAESVWNGIRTFTDNVPPEKQLRVLRGEALRIPVDQLSASGLDYVKNERAVNDQARQKFGLPPSTDPLPTWVEFTRASGSPFATPSLFLILEGRGGNAVLGGVPLGKQFNDELKKMWMLPGDEESDPGESRLVQPPQPPDKPTPNERPDLRRRLAQVGKAAPLSFLALTPEHTQDPGSPYGGTVGAFLDKAQGVGSFTPHKWRRGILLVTHPTWFFDAFGNVPWAVMKQLHAAEKRNGGVLTLPDLWVTADLAPSQLEVLSCSFPEAANLWEWQALLLAIHKQPGLWLALRGPSGAPARSVLPALSDAMRAELGGVEHAFRFRVLQEDHLDLEPPNRTYTLQAYSADGTAVGKTVLLLTGPGRKEVGTHTK